MPYTRTLIPKPPRQLCPQNSAHAICYSNCAIQHGNGYLGGLMNTNTELVQTKQTDLVINEQDKHSIHTHAGLDINIFGLSHQLGLQVFILCWPNGPP